MPSFTCDHCAEVIGVYEPLILVRGDEIRETSRAAEPKLLAQPGDHYHRTCYLERARLEEG